jgi:UDP-glucose 4-epimerase
VRILVTGAAGFIGSNVVDRVLSDGHTVVGIDDLSTGKMANLAAAGAEARFSFERADVTGSGLIDLMAGIRPDVVLHLAAQIDVRVSVRDPLLDARLNVLGTINVLEACRLAGVGKMVFTSSGGSIYGAPDVLPVDEQAPVLPESPYAAAKAAAELYLNVYRVSYGLASTSLALANVYGPRQDPHGEAGVVAIFGTAMLEGRRTKIFGDGSASRDYVHVSDVADAFSRTLVPGTADGFRLNIGTGVETSVSELHSQIARIVGVPDNPEFAPARTGELAHIALDVRLAEKTAGWVPQIAIEDGLTNTVSWLRGTIGSTH